MTEDWRLGKVEAGKILPPGLKSRLGAAERGWLGRSQLGCHSPALGYTAIWLLAFEKTVRNGTETQHILLRFAGACTRPGPWFQLVALGSRRPWRDSGMFLRSETSLLVGGS